MPENNKFDITPLPFRWHCLRQCQRKGRGYPYLQFDPRPKGRGYGYLKTSTLWTSTI